MCLGSLMECLHVRQRERVCVSFCVRVCVCVCVCVGVFVAVGGSMNSDESHLLCIQLIKRGPAFSRALME